MMATNKNLSVCGNLFYFYKTHLTVGGGGGGDKVHHKSSLKLLILSQYIL